MIHKTVGDDKETPLSSRVQFTFKTVADKIKINGT